MSENKLTFFRQSGWLAIATATSGVFLIAVYPVITKKTADPGIFMALLRVFTVLAIPTAGLQIVMAQDAAAAITPQKKEQLAAASQAIARGILGFWVCLAVLCAVFQHRIASTLNLAHESALWVTLFLVLAQLFLPFGQGLLQGTQNFAWLGWSIILSGLGRFAGVCIMVLIFKTQSTGALFGALLGLGAATTVGLFPSRTL
ncbi:MAG TPA: hypothetical protein VGR78_15620, partial [Verrucomicrobiae bacterium]|nr:hypothetical protein [Verrucomicrobiae bacterium]